LIRGFRKIRVAHLMWQTPNNPQPRLFQGKLQQSLTKLLMLCGLCITPWVAASEPLRIASLPMESRELTLAAFEPVAHYLEKQLQQSVELVFLESNQEVVEALDTGHLDIAMLGPLPFITLSAKNSQIHPLVFFRESSGKARYRCKLVAFAGDKIDITQLRNQRVALTQPLSTCGYLGTNAILRTEAGHDLEQTDYTYYNTHEAAALAVIAGRADVAGIKDAFAFNYASLGLEVLAASDWVPAVGLFVNADQLSDEQIVKIREILLTAPEREYVNWGHFMRYGMQEASYTDFESLKHFGDPALIPLSSGPD
jgi:phosphonate transport system substrate-binding protein